MNKRYPNWQTFAYIHNGQVNSMFENLARALWKQELKIEYLPQRIYQTGNESAVVEKEGMIIGFQAKYFEHSINAGSIINSMQKAKEDNPNQTHYYIYCNKAFGNPRRQKGGEKADINHKKTKKEERIESAATRLGLTIVWRLDKDILDKVFNNPSLYEAFFRDNDKSSDEEEGSYKPVRLNNINFLDNRYFTGRKNVLDTIESGLNSGPTRTQRLYIFGMGGVGKSETVRRYVRNHLDVYDCIWWIDAQEEQQVVQAYIDLARRKGISNNCDNIPVDDIVSMVKQWLQKKDSGSWLMVFDNVVSGEILKRFFPIQHGGQLRHIIVTTQDERLHKLKDMGGEGIELGVFSLEEAIIFLKRRTELQDSLGSCKLSAELGFLPLALEHAAAYICNYQIDYEKYLALYQESTERLLRMDGFDEDGHTVFNTIEISINGLKKRYGEAPYQLLCIFAFMSADNINLCWLEGVDPIPYPPPLNGIINNKVDLKEAVKKLNNLSLLHYVPQEDVIWLHRLLQKVVANKELNNKKRWVGICKQILIKQTIRQFSIISDSQVHFNRLSAHIISVLDNDTECNEESVKLKRYLSSGLLNNEQNDRALTYCNQAIESSIQLWGHDNSQIRDLQLLKGKILLQQGLFDEAIGVLENVLVQQTNQFNLRYIQDVLNTLFEEYADYQEVFELYKNLITNQKENILQDHILQLADIQNFLGTALREKGEYDNALYYYQRACAIREERLGKKHLETAKSYNNIGLTYLYKKEYKKAHPFLMTSIDIIANKLGLKEHEYLAQVYNNLGEFYRCCKELKEALECQELAKDIRVQRFGDNHSEVANTYNNIGSIYLDMGETELALKLFKQAADIYERVKGNNHSYTGIAYLNIAKAYDKENRINEAIRSADKALGILKKSLIPTHEYIKKVKNLLIRLEERRRQENIPHVKREGMNKPDDG